MEYKESRRDTVSSENDRGGREDFNLELKNSGKSIKEGSYVVDGALEGT